MVKAGAEERPNIIWLMAEDMGIDLEIYGMAGVQTPHLNQMAAEGALYKRAYATNPICSPSRSAMMVGTHQNIFDAQHHRSHRDRPLPEPYKPITTWLREQGYTCVLGSDLVLQKGRKVDVNFKHKAVGAYDGVENFGLFDKLDTFTAEDQPFFNQIQLKVTHRGDWWREVREQSEDPVCLDEIELPPYMADTPEIRYDWAAYLDTVEYMDNEVGLILERLKKEGIEDNTIVIFVADNGRCNIRGKGYLQEPGIHVPMIVWAPGRIEAGTVVEELVTLTDISASILDLAGADIPDYVTGRPVIGREHPNYREYVRTARDIWDEIDEASRSVVTQRFKYIKNHIPDAPWDAGQAYLDLNRPAVHVMRRLAREGALSDAEMTFFEDQKPEEELYDLENDPHEMYNLANNPEYASVLAEMRALEREWQQENTDFGLKDLGQREPDKNLRSVQVMNAVQEKAPELWERLEAGELMPTQSWKEYLDK
ncbi:MAG: sulfatase family protein [Opitutales bacterium]